MERIEKIIIFIAWCVFFIFLAVNKKSTVEISGIGVWGFVISSSFLIYNSIKYYKELKNKKKENK